MNGQQPPQPDPCYGDDASTLLDPLETKSEFAFLPPPPARQTPTQPLSHFRNSGDGPTRRRIYEALVRNAAPINRLYEFAECGTHKWIAQTNDDDANYVICENRCKDRFCPGCGRMKSHVVAENLHRYVKDRDVRFLTFTLVAGDQKLQTMLTRLYDSFRRLRQTKLWKRTQTGGAAFLEIKIGSGSGRWHPHLHVISEGKFIRIHDLKDAWQRITAGSHQVDVQRVHSKESIAHYVTKYVSKPFSAQSVRDDDQLDELLHTLSGTRTALTYGSWRGLRLLKPLDDRTYNYLMTFEELKRRAHDGDRWCIQIWNLLAISYGRDDAVLDLPPESSPDPPSRSATEPKLFDTYETLR